MNILVKANKGYICLLSLLALILLSACSRESPPADITEEPLGPPDRVDVVYFYSSEECHCQEVLGSYIYGSLFMHFNEELTSGKLTFQNLDLDDDKNAVMAHKYNATAESLFINTVKANTERFIAAPEIILAKEDPIKLDNLINSRIQQVLEGKE